MTSIKKIKAVRIVAKPFVDWKRNKDHDKYLRSPDHFYLQTLKNIHKGERCFIIGNGPSLRAADLDMLKGEYTFAANRIFVIFNQTEWRPTYFLSIDDRILNEHQNEFLSYDLGHMFLAHNLCTINAPSNVLTRIYYGFLTFNIDPDLYKIDSMYISEDISNHFCDGQTITYGAIQLAIYMGFKEIYLLGVDHNYSKVVGASGKIEVDPTVQDYFDNKDKPTYPSNLHASQYAYTIAKEYCDTHGIKICNATRGGKLEVFERVDFDSLFSGE